MTPLPMRSVCVAPSSAGWAVFTPIALLLSGCVTIYQPLSGLQTPRVVDYEVENFPNLKLRVHCPGKDLLDSDEAQKLCQRVEQLFLNQGAEVEIVDLAGTPLDDEAPEASKTIDREALTLELSARSLGKNTSLLMWTFSILTFTLVPGMSEYSFVQDVRIRDAQGALLATAELKGRFVRFFGLGYWASNGLANWWFRDDDEDLNDAAFRRRLSQDLYGQLSQLVFNAQLRQRVLNGPALLTTTSTKSGR